MKNGLLKLLYLFLIRPWLTVFIGVSYDNRAAFQQTKQFIAVGNHNSHFDALSIMAALPMNQLKTTYTIAAADYFGKTSWSTKAVNFFFNALLINRKRKAGEPPAIDIMDSHLKNGHSLVLFPEGSRGAPGVMIDYKKGIAILLQQNPSIPFIPIYLDGFGRILPKDKTLIIPMVCKVRFGNAQLAKGTTIDSILEEVKEAIISLKEDGERDRNKFKEH